MRLGKGSQTVVARFRVITRGTAVTFSIPRRALGSPTWFVFEMAAAREWNDEGAVPPRAKPDFVPARRHVPLHARQLRQTGGRTRT